MTKRCQLSSAPEIEFQDESLAPAAGPRSAGSYPSWEEIARASQMMHITSLRHAGQLRRAFKDGAARYRFLERLRWPHGFECGRCGESTLAARPQPDLLVCGCCGALSSVTVGTMFQHSAAPLEDWFELFWGIAADRLCIDPVTVMQLAKLPTEHMAQRCADELQDGIAGCVRRQKLAGLVEIDSRVLDLGTTRVIVLAAVEREAGKSVRTRMRHVPNVGREAMRRFVKDVIEPGSTVRTDCWTGYAELETPDYHHEVETDLPSGCRIGLPGVNRAMSLLRRWLRTRPTVNAAVLAGLLDEFCLRLDHAGQPAAGALFCKLLGQVMQQHHLGRGKLARRKSGVRKIEAADLDDELDESGQRQSA
ncbi:MAG: transposase [Deltaproteobacteria bacterium]|nr:transposase [Deltaproteobacteria bacterium]